VENAQFRLLAGLPIGIHMVVIHALGYGFGIGTSGLEIRFAPLSCTIHGTFGAFFLAGCAGAFVNLLVHPPDIPRPLKVE
jgi:hypothetical protein|tara:strand:- start:134 stop:373 length:240 start_codon:yes stop_codon:yes gene_type:complete